MSETEENNKLIAEFMGLEEPFFLPQHGYIQGSVTWKDTFAASELKYSHNWEWLVPAIKKCAELSKYPMVIHEFDKSKVHADVISFIKEYNKTQE